MDYKSTPSMLAATDAIVLSLQPYSDKAHILHAYTRTGGRVNYKVYGLGRKHPIGIYMPLSLIRITADYPSNGLPTIREAVSQRSGLSAEGGLYKQTVALFIAEVLSHVLRHPMPDEPMFDFIAQAVQELDQTDEPQNFHLVFMVNFAAKLGFAIPEESSITNLSPSLREKVGIGLSRKERQDTLHALCDYFAEHVETWQQPRSLDVLIEVFN